MAISWCRKCCTFPPLHTRYRLQSSERYKRGCLVLLSTNWGSDWGENKSFGLESAFYKNAEQWLGLVLYCFSKAVSLVNIKMTWEMLHTSRQFIWNSYVQSRSNWWDAHTHNTYTHAGVTAAGCAHLGWVFCMLLHPGHLPLHVADTSSVRQITFLRLVLCIVY